MDEYWQGSHSELAYLASLCRGAGGHNSSEALGVHRSSAQQIQDGKDSLHLSGDVSLRGGIEMAAGRAAAVCGMLESAEQWIAVSVEESGHSARILIARGPWGQVTVTPGSTWRVSEPRRQDADLAHVSSLIATGLAHAEGKKVSVRQHSQAQVGHVTVFGSEDGPWKLQAVMCEKPVPGTAVSREDASQWLGEWLGLR